MVKEKTKKKISIQDIIENGSLEDKRALFEFTMTDSVDTINLKFNLWSRYNFYKYFTSPDALFHEDIDSNNIKAYKGEIDSFTDGAFRGGAKTARTKLFVAFAICNDRDRFRKYIKVLSSDGKNSKQIVTDIYNMLVNPSVKEMYPEIFAKTGTKREETMSSFTTSFGVKMLAGTVGTEQRGALQDSSRPDFTWFEDFESRATLRSLVKTKAIWDNMEEARTGLSIDGACIYTCNYISEAGNVHKLVKREDGRNIVMMTPIISNDGVLAWPERYSFADVEKMKKTDDDFEGERLCKPSASREIVFNREMVEKQIVRQPIEVDGEARIYFKYNASHRYGAGGDVAGGVGLDSCASVFINYSTIPANVVLAYDCNTIIPEDFGDEFHREGLLYGKCLLAPENNYGTECILRLKQLGANIYKTEPKDDEINESKLPTKYGWGTNSLTKPKMILALKKAVNEGLLNLNDKRLIEEVKNYTRNDLITNVSDPRLTTRHFDLLMACAIAWQMKNYAEISTEEEEIDMESLFEDPIYPDINV